MLYPPEEQTCWQSGCHGARPYEDGFSLPTAIPPVVGPDAPWHNFQDASVLFAFLSTAMPWHKPGSLDSDVYWRLTAYLLRENGYENPYEELGPDNAGFIAIGSGDNVVGTEQISQSTPHPTAQSASGQMQELLTGHQQSYPAAIWVVLTLGVVLIGLVFWLRRKRGND
jgi:hypothetical protein